MIAYVKGELAFIYERSVVVDVGGVGYLVNVSTATISRMSQNTQVQLFTYMQSNESGQSLHGFLTQEEVRLFMMLISVSGIGPKVASAILGAMTPQQIILSIVAEDAAALSKAPGVGKKTAQRIMLELKDKMKTTESWTEMPSSFAEPTSGTGGTKQDATDALLALGYGRSESVQAVLEVAEDGISTENIIRLALKKLAKQVNFS
ncbi:MAG: Holliday junction branch migration protein RuvA [Defluviitaleaceae bacterium]|nr:Holliday junction branch migration protein RuvA [Defluviitaleaceae bacterium]